MYLMSWNSLMALLLRLVFGGHFLHQLLLLLWHLELLLGGNLWEQLGLLLLLLPGLLLLALQQPLQCFSVSMTLILGVSSPVWFGSF